MTRKYLMMALLMSMAISVGVQASEHGDQRDEQAVSVLKAMSTRLASAAEPAGVPGVGFIATSACMRCRMAARPYAIVAAFSITPAQAYGAGRLSKARP